MRLSKLVLLILGPFLALGLPRLSLRAGERMSPELLWKLGRLGASAVSPDGAQVAYLVRSYELAKNSGRSSLRLVGRDGRGDRVLLADLPSAGDLQWVGERLYFVGKKDPEAKSQVWSLDPSSGALTEVTAVDSGVATLRVAPTGKHLAYSASVKIDPGVADLYPDLPEADGKIIDTLMFRHWSAWRDGSYSHLFLATLGEDGRASEVRDLMAGLRFDCPVPPFAGSEHYAWSPEGDEIAFTAKMVNNWAESTDTDIYLVRPFDEKSKRFLCVTAGRDGYDTSPSYSPDGRWLAFQAMERPGFEADRNRILLFDRKSRELEELTVGLDQQTHSASWAPDGKTVFFFSEQLGTEQIFSLDLRHRKLRSHTSGVHNWRLRGVFPDGATLLVARSSMIRPYELVALSLESGEAGAITGINDAIYAKLDLPRVEERWVRSTDGKKVHNWVIYPPDFDPQKTWPLLTYCQGGPQGQIGQWFSYRWNFHLMAAKGYVVIAVNRRGLPGFGQAWNDQISGDWGGQAMQDILAATDSMIAEPWIDARRLGAIGASFGGYTVYWLMGNHEDRFQAMIAHCGVFNLESMYGSTEELFFVNWDLGGPYWKSAAVQRKYDRFSPHRFVKNWKTPLLVVHGEKDFRVPLTQGIEAFTAAQVEGVPSRFLYFPSEGHWVLGPQNGVLWHRVFFEWLDRWIGHGPGA